LAAAAEQSCSEIQWLQNMGSAGFTPDDGRALGLEGMIDNLIHETENAQT
jgi:hypothetical protein